MLDARNNPHKITSSDFTAAATVSAGWARPRRDKVHRRSSAPATGQNRSAHRRYDVVSFDSNTRQTDTSERAAARPAKRLRSGELDPTPLTRDGRCGFLYPSMAAWRE